MNRTAGLGFSMFVAGLLTVAGATVFAGNSQAASSATGNDKATRQLFQAVYANDLPQVQLSVGDGADVDARDRWGMTPAEIAIDRGNYRIAHFLVSIHNTRRTQETPETPAAAASKAEIGGGGSRQAPGDGDGDGPRHDGCPARHSCCLPSLRIDPGPGAGHGSQSVRSGDAGTRLAAFWGDRRRRFPLKAG